jgi:hypothetical protein
MIRPLNVVEVARYLLASFELDHLGNLLGIDDRNVDGARENLAARERGYDWRLRKGLACGDSRSRVEK